MNVDIAGILKASVGAFSVGALLSAAAVALICVVVIRLVMRVVDRLVGRSHADERLKRYFRSAVQLVLYILAGIIVADALGVNMTSIVALLSVGSLGVTLAAEDMLGNLAGGLVILSSKPFTVGDYIEVGGASGTVREVTLNHTKLETVDGLSVLLPNKELASSKLTNYTMLGRRRIVHTLTASYDAPTEAVKTACRQAVAAAGEKVLPDPAPFITLDSYGESAIQYTVRCWAKVEDYWDVYYQVGEALRETFAANGVEMTYNHLNIHIMDDGRA